MADELVGKLRLEGDNRPLKRAEKEALQSYDNIQKGADKTKEKIKQNNAEIARSEQQLAEVTAKSKARAQGKYSAYQSTAESLSKTYEESRHRTIEKQKELADRRSLGAALVKEEEGLQQRLTLSVREGMNRRLIQLRYELDEQKKIRTQAAQNETTEQRELRRIIDRAAGGPADARDRIISAIGTSQQARRRSSMIALGGYTPKEALYEQLSGSFRPEEAKFLSGLGGARPHSFGGADREAQERLRALRAERNAEIKLGSEMAAMYKRNEADKSKAKKEETSKRLKAESQLYKAEMAMLKEELSQIRQADKARADLERPANAAIRRARGGGLQIMNEVRGLLNPEAIQQLVAQGHSPEDAITALLGKRFGYSGASYLASGAGKKPPILGGAGGSRGGGAGGGSLLTRLLGAGGGGRLGMLASNVLGGLGIGVGAYGVGSLVNAAVEGEKLATSYGRQLVAARNLAGGQERLNQLLAIYNKASGGAVAKTDSLANVTRLLAIGQAKTNAEFQKFTRGTRGASIALGRPETEVQEQTQLAIANTSKRRLDQIGLGVKEVDLRIESLRKNNKSWNREMAFGGAVIDLLNEKYGSLTDTIEGQATGVERLAKSWSDLKLSMGQNAKPAVDTIAGTLANLVGSFEQNRQERALVLGRRYFNDLNMRGFTGINGFDVIGALSGRTGTQVAAEHVLKNRYLLPNTPPSGYIGGPEDYRSGPTASRFNEEQMDVVRNANKQVVQLERQYSNQRISATAQYEEQRLNIIRNYEKSMAREEQDFARQRARGLRDYEKQIVDIMRDGQERDREMRSDYDKQISEINEDSNKRRAKIEENYQEQQEKAAKDHRDRLLHAAGQLDAIAILEERKRWRDDNKERKKQHDEALDDEREAADERRQDALDALNERLEDARKADEKRLADMAAARAQQLADEDEDRQIQKDRAKEDHDDELAELKRQHDLQMAEIERQYEANKTALEDALAAELASVGVYVAGYNERMEKKDKILEKWLDDYIDKLEKHFKADQQLGTYEYDPRTGPKLPYQGYASGGYVKQTGRAMVHAGEFVLSRQMMAAGWSPNNQYNNQRSIVFAEGAIQIATTPGYEAMVGDLVRKELLDVLESV